MRIAGVIGGEGEGERREEREERRELHSPTKDRLSKRQGVNKHPKKELEETFVCFICS